MPVIQIDNVSKSYRLGAIGGGTLREDVARWWARVRGRPDPSLKIGPEQIAGVRGQKSEVSSPPPGAPAHRGTDAPPPEAPRHRHTDLFWALRNISLEVKEGEILGIIGRNGAGKSTLLKILSRVTGPTEGEIRVRGRIASLLEVGTGFHPELTGRENVFLNGAILGMTKPEIRRKFDEIVDFSGVEQFIDTPVKRYSSGMYVRLAFAVAAHLEPEILVVDEVLAVGDADFQKKCLGKMEEVSRGGRTVLIVSHNMGMITALCPRAVLLADGRLEASGNASQVVMRYLGRGAENSAVVDFTGNGRPVGDQLATLRRAWIEDASGQPIREVDIREPFRVTMEYQLHTCTPLSPYANIHVFDQRGEYVFVTASRNYVAGGDVPGIYQAECWIPGNLLNDGCYFLGLALTFTHQGLHVSFWEKDALSISVRDPVLETVDGHRLGYVGPMPGPVRPQLDWEIAKVG